MAEQKNVQEQDINQLIKVRRDKLKELQENGYITLPDVDDSIRLEQEDLLITMTQKEGYVTDGDNNITVVLDTNMTNELIEEGLVREIISKIQTMRKEADFEVMDHIIVGYTADQEIEAIFARYRDEIAEEVLANEVASKQNSGYHKQWSINGHDVTLSVVKQ